MGDDGELGPVEAGLRRRREEAYSYVTELADRASRNLPTVSPGYLWTVLEMAAETEKYRGLLAMMNRTYESLRDRKNAEIAELEAALAVSDAKAADLNAKLVEAEEVILLASHELGPEHPVWTTLDGYDGSMDAVQELKALCDARIVGFPFEITRAGKL